jgi:hypothetical protein
MPLTMRQIYNRLSEDPSWSEDYKYKLVETQGSPCHYGDYVDLVALLYDITPDSDDAEKFYNLGQTLTQRYGYPTDEFSFGFEFENYNRIFSERKVFYFFSLKQLKRYWNRMEIKYFDTPEENYIYFRNYLGCDMAPCKKLLGFLKESYPDEGVGASMNEAIRKITREFQTKSARN